MFLIFAAALTALLGLLLRRFLRRRGGGR
jgi:hypothetical protein